MDKDSRKINLPSWVKWIGFIGWGVIVLFVIIIIYSSGNSNSGKVANENNKIQEITDEEKGKEDTKKYLEKSSQSEKRFGLTEEKRREIYKETATAGDRATKEAEEMYPVDIFDPNYKEGNVKKAIDKGNELEMKYEKEIARKYNITQKVITKIIAEGIEKSWPMN